MEGGGGPLTLPAPPGRTWWRREWRWVEEVVVLKAEQAKRVKLHPRVDLVEERVEEVVVLVVVLKAEQAKRAWGEVDLNGELRAQTRAESGTPNAGGQPGLWAGPPGEGGRGGGTPAPDPGGGPENPGSRVPIMASSERRPVRSVIWAAGEARLQE
ncbi:unnamed protein product [Boreogadus saida]